MDIATEKESIEVVDLLWEAIGEEIPDKVKLLQLSRAMYKEDREEAKKKFKELLRSLTPELVRSRRLLGLDLIVGQETSLWVAC